MSAAHRTLAAVLFVLLVCLPSASSASGEANAIMAALADKQALEQRLKALEERESSLRADLAETTSAVKHLIVGVKCGEGIRIVLSDAPRETFEGVSKAEDLNRYIVHDSDIVRLCALLLTQGAEGISVNGIPVDASMGIKCAGPVIRVRGKAVSAPFTVAAIGDGETLYKALQASGLPDEWKRFGLGCEISHEAELFIPPHQLIDMRYAKAAEEGR